MEEVFFRHADAYIDLHSGDGYEELTPYVYCQGAADPSVAKRSRAMAGQADVPWMVRSGSGSGGAFNRAGALGLPGILLPGSFCLVLLCLTWGLLRVVSGEDLMWLKKLAVGRR